MLTWKQQKILEFLMSHETMTKKDAMGMIDTHFHNGDKHVGEVLSRMVKRGFITRIKPGLFKLKSVNPDGSNDFKNPNQLDLFI